MSHEALRRMLGGAAALLLVAGCGSSSHRSAPTTPPRPATTAPATRPAPTTQPTTTTTRPRPTTTATTTTAAPPPTTAPPPRPGADGLTARQAATGAWIVDIDAQRLRVSLMPGKIEPKGTFIHPPTITPDLARTVIAAFNGGFQFRDAQGGFYLGGVESAPLVAGAASLVIRKDGTATVGAWQRDVTMGPDVEGVLQNLQLMVDRGRLTDVTDTDVHRWGSTFPRETTPLVPRSGVCVSGDGQLHWVGGLNIGAATLATTMVQAGCMRGMELDINPMFVSFAVFDHPDPGNPATIVGHNLFEGMHYQPSDYVKGRDRNWLMLSTS